MLVHTIRLREPWTRSDDEGVRRLSRRFAAPTGIHNGERVFLAAGAMQTASRVLLNEEPLGTLPAETSARWEITDRISLRNEVCFVLDQATNASDGSGSGRELIVRLEIEAGD